MTSQCRCVRCCKLQVSYAFETSDRSPSDPSDRSPIDLSDRSPIDPSDRSPSDPSDRSPIDLSDRSPSDLSDRSPSDLSDRSSSDLSDRSPSDLSDRSPIDPSDRSSISLGSSVVIEQRPLIRACSTGRLRHRYCFDCDVRAGQSKPSFSFVRAYIEIKIAQCNLK